jgi:hypothetical protein
MIRHWWVHSDYNIDDENWFVEVKLATRNMWEIDNHKVIEVVEWEPIRMEIIKLECEIARLTNLLISKDAP